MGCIKSKKDYKLLLLWLKYIPFITSLFYSINLILLYFNIATGLEHICYMSFLPWILVYLSSKVFDYCRYYKEFLSYILLVNMISYVNHYYALPKEALNIISINLLIVCSILFIILSIHVRHNKKVFGEDNIGHRCWKQQLIRGGMYQSNIPIKSLL